MVSFEVDINPEILEFAISSSGYSLEDLARKVNKKKFDLEYLNKLILGDVKLTITELEKIDELLKRGVPFFFLSDIPDEERILRYRKKIPNLGLNPSTEVTLREFNFLREEIKFMLEENEIDFSRKARIFNINNKPEDVAKHFRELFKFNNLNIEKEDASDVFKFLRGKIEEFNVFVFKNYTISEKLDDNLRGCIFLGNGLPPLILVNSNDNKYAEIFTLLHEFGHFLLNKEELDTDDVSDNYNSPIERWCNDFAYNFLISEEIEKKERFSKENSENLLKPESLNYLSKKYKVSKAAFMYRFLIKNIITLEVYNSFKSSYVYKKKSDEKKRGGGDYYNTIRDKFSRKYISLVGRSYKNNTISMGEAFNYLKVKNTEKFEFMQEVVRE